MASIYKKSGRAAWIISYFDAEGRRREKSTRTTVRRVAERIAADIEAEVALRREGLIDPRQDRLAEHRRTSLAEHVAAYVQHCRDAEQAERHVDQKKSHLDDFLEQSSLTRLADLDARIVENDLRRLRERGLSARTCNFRRQIIVAFANWLLRTGRLASNPLLTVAKLDEQNDRRRIRRPITDDELASLVKVARPRGRALWYLLAALAGLRKGELLSLRWGDIDLKAETLSVRNSKAGRVDEIPLHPQLAAELAAAWPAMALPSAPVFARCVTDQTRREDFERAEIKLVDDAGRVADLHACRTALGTRLARQGVAPQIAQRIMRHADYRTTLRHYTVLGLVDTARAVNELPSIGTTGHLAQGTGTDGLVVAEFNVQQNRQQSGAAEPPRDAMTRDDDEQREHGDDAAELVGIGGYAPECDDTRREEMERVTGFEPATFSLGS